MSGSFLEILRSLMILSFDVNTFKYWSYSKKVIVIFIVVIVTVCPYWSFQADCQVKITFNLPVWLFR